MPVKDLTPEQIRKAMIYGVCKTCRAPREGRVTSTTQDDGKTVVVTRAIVCPNGHPQ
jgi:hypothetical protein